MSKLIWYHFPPNQSASLKILIDWLPEDIKKNYYVLRLCLKKVNKDFFDNVPYFVWKTVLSFLCKTKIRNISVNDILKYWDDYICDSEQKKINPVLMIYSDSGNLHSFFGNLEFDLIVRNINVLIHNLQIKCHPFKHKYEFPILRHGDLLLGIRKDTNIKNINFKIGGKNYGKIETKDLFEFELNDEKVVYWSFRDIMPIYLRLLDRHEVFLKIETYGNKSIDDSVSLLYGYLHPYFSEIMAKNNIYKNVLYEKGKMLHESEIEKITS